MAALSETESLYWPVMFATVVVVVTEVGGCIVNVAVL
jgi:hypothetical protein